jgi:O-antigen/teichoic acid export membrane protein
MGSDRATGRTEFDTASVGAPGAREHAHVTLARNVFSRYVLIVVNVAIGLVILPYNVRHLGEAAYGLWMLAASITAYFTLLDLGYGGAVVRFVAEFRARRDARALNEVLSTMAYVFTAIGLGSYLVAMAVAVLLPHIFNLEPDQVHTGRLVLLITAAQVALYFRFAIYGAVINGFERYYLNNLVGMLFNLAAAVVNVVALWLGYGLVELVAATTLMRIAPLWVYRRNAYAVFPELSIRRSLVRRDRLRELSGFSIYLAVADWSGRITYTADTFFVGIFMNTAAVGVYAVAQRLSEAVLNLTQQLHTLMMPAVVHRAIEATPDRQQSLLLRATRFQLAIAMCLCGGVAAVAHVLVVTWFGPGLERGVPIFQLLCIVAVLRASAAMPNTVLQGTGHHRYVATVSAASALVNLVLSVAFVLTWGLIGAALATLLSALGSSMFIFPRACRVVGLSVWQGYRQIVWPTAWPALIVVTVLTATKGALPPGFVPVLAHLAFGGLMYASLFVLFGLDRDERHWFVAAAHRVLGRDREAAQLAESEGVG